MNWELMAKAGYRLDAREILMYLGVEVRHDPNVDWDTKAMAFRFLSHAFVHLGKTS